MGRKVNNIRDTQEKDMSKDPTLQELTTDICKGEYVLILGSDAILKPQYGNGNSQEYILSEYEKEHPTRINDTEQSVKLGISEFIKNDWDYDIEDVSPELISILEKKYFRVVLTTAFDGYVEAVMRKVYGNELRIINIYDLESVNQFRNKSEYDMMPPTLFYAFGKAQYREEYVLSENDYIKLILRWIKNPMLEDFIRYMKKKRILGIGCKFENWYFRFFWYCLRQDFNHLEGDVAISLQNDCESDRRLAEYLKKINVDNKGNANAFIQNLNKMLSDPLHLYEQNLKEKLRAGGVFISYACEDFHLVCNIYATLTSLGTPVWFDNKELLGGDKYNKRISDAINQCKVFIPILSYQTHKDMTENNWRYYKDEEWEAIKYNHEARIVPIAIHGFNLREDRELLPEHMKDVSIIEWDGNGKELLIKTITQRVK